MSLQKFARTSTAKVQPPVCIGDIASYDFSVSVEEKTDAIVKRLREDASLPGVILHDEQGFVGMIPRQTIFERLGRRYGIELFLDKEINSLYRELHAPKPLIVGGETRVEDAVKKALARDDLQLYHPVVVFHAGKYTLLNMHTLITTQTEMLANLNTVATKLNHCGVILEADEKDIAIEKIIDALREVVPFHDAGLYTSLDLPSIYVKGEEFVHLLSEKENKANPFQLSQSFNQIICVDDKNGAPIWGSAIETLEKLPKAWMGVPLVDGQRYLGTLLLCRYMHTPFSANEKELTNNYAWYLSRIVASFLLEGHERERSHPFPGRFDLQRRVFCAN